jgi:hypothetical protein
MLVEPKEDIVPVTEKSKVQSNLLADAPSDVDRIRTAIEKREERISNLELGYRKDRLIGRFSAEDIAEGLYAAMIGQRELPEREANDDWAGLVDEYLRRYPVDPKSLPSLTLNTPPKQHR